jgi:mono/diheme cytochrome c family protein
MILVRIAAIFLLGSLAACGGGSGGGGSSAATSDAADTQSAGSLPSPSWYDTGKPLLERYCVACHSAGGVAPFALETYQQALGKRSALVYVLESDSMPPPGFADLQAQERSVLREWLDAGAPRGDPSQTPLPVADDAYTYHADVRPLLERHCTGCHMDGGIGPFALDSYERVVAVAAAAAFAVENGSMPPWPPTPGYTRIEHPRALPAEEKYILLSWLQGDLAEGNPAEYVAGEVQAETDPPDFNLELPLPQAYTPTLRPDDHRCFAIEWPLDEFAYVTDVDVVPDQVKEVHHVIVSIAEPEDASIYYAADGEGGRPGWYCLGAGGVDGAPLPRQIGGWVPGGGREIAPKGTGVGVRPGSVLVVQMHYNTLVAEPTPDQSTILVATTDEVQRPASGFLITDPRWLAPGGMPIAAGEQDAQHQVTFPARILARVFGQQAEVGATDPWVLHNGFIHMHNLGKSGRITLQRADGTEQVLLDIRNWDFNWQGTYRFAREQLVQPDDRIKLECSWDNSQANQPFVDGEQLTTQYVEWGDGTQDEMCLMSVFMTLPREGYDYSYGPTLHIESPAYRQAFTPGGLIPLRLLLTNFTLQEPGQAAHDDAAGHANAGGSANAGHYHVYLDAEDDSADHLTAWDDNYYFQLPEDLAPGPHRLRVDLRGHDHEALGVSQTVEFEVVEENAAGQSELVDVASWNEQGRASDPLAAHRPAQVSCPANSWYEEDGALEVETGYCNYLSLVQPSKTDILPGDRLHLVLWHGDLAFEETATAHVAISIGGELVWEQAVKIPTEAEIFDVKVPLDFDAPAGTPVEYHLHNHGYNTWTLLRLEIER